jgi:sugar phosphate permease
LFGSKKRYLFFSALIPGVCFILLGINSFAILAVVLLVAITSFGLSRDVLFQNYMNKYIESHHRATVISAISMVDRLVRAVLYPLFGLLVSWSLKYAFIILGVIILVCAVISRVEEKQLID